MKIIIVIIVLILALIVMFIFAFYPPFLLFNNCNINNFSSYGNFITGSLGTLAAIIAAILIFFTYINQNEYSKQQDKYYKLQINYNEKSNFENNFYKMIENFSKQIDSLFYDISLEVGKTNPYKGVNFLSFCIRDLFNLSHFENEQVIKSIFINKKAIFYSQFLDIFFSILFIYKFINDNKIDADTNSYFRYFAIQIPKDLKLMIAIFRICDKDKVKELVENYKLLNDFDFSNIFQNENQFNNFTTLLRLPK